MTQHRTPRSASAEGAALYTEIARLYDVVTEHVTVGGRSFTMLTVRDTNKLIDAIDPALFAEDERLPYWAELWTSSITLASWCLAHAWERGSPVLELGCGLGLAGIAAAAAGADVTMTDYDDHALLFARYNAMQNLSSAQLSGSVRIHQLDWRKPPHDQRYPVIIGADVMYERRMFAPLLTLFETLLLPGGTVVLTDPDRAIGADFLRLAADSGFLVETERLPVSRRSRETTVVRAVLRRGSNR